MLSISLDKAGELLDRRFLIAWWFPTLIGVTVMIGMGIISYGPDDCWSWWQQQDVSIQGWLACSTLLIVTILAYLFRVFVNPLVRFYEGYWPFWTRRLVQKWVRARWLHWKRERADAAQTDLSRYSALQDRLHHGYPYQAERLLPTRLGNALRSAEDYPAVTYGMDAVFWWPRLFPLLPEAMRRKIEDALTPLLALLSVATLTIIAAMVGAISFLLARAGWWQSLAVLLAGLALSRVAYHGAVSQARSYGQAVRAAVDLYRFDLLTALHQSLPATPQEERDLWRQLAVWLYNQDRGAVQGLTYDHGGGKTKAS